MADHEPMTDVACGEPELSEELRDALVLLRDRSDNDNFRALVDDLLAGRCSLLEASGTAAFSDVVFARIAQEFSELTEDEKRNLTGQAEPSASSDATGSCGIPCATCTSICAISGTTTPTDSGERGDAP